MSTAQLKIPAWAMLVVGVAINTGIFVIGAVNYFATIKYVDQKHDEAIKHSNVNYERNRDLIERMVKSVEVIDQRTYEMNGRKGPPPASEDM
jgi:hypothetical protein